MVRVAGDECFRGWSVPSVLEGAHFSCVVSASQRIWCSYHGSNPGGLCSADAAWCK